MDPKIFSYSEEWKNLLATALSYQNQKKIYFNVKDNQKIYDIKHALVDRDLTYYALQVLETMPEEIAMSLLDELVHVVLHGNISDASTATKIISNLKTKMIRLDIVKILDQHVVEGAKDIYVIKDIALLLYTLRYKRELLEFVDTHFEALKRAEFIESEEDLDELHNLEELA